MHTHITKQTHTLPLSFFNISVLPHVVLSCGHDSPAVSAILALTGYIFCECQRSVDSADVDVPTTD